MLGMPKTIMQQKHAFGGNWYKKNAVQMTIFYASIVQNGVQVAPLHTGALERQLPLHYSRRV